MPSKLRLVEQCWRKKLGLRKAGVASAVTESRLAEVYLAGERSPVEISWTLKDGVSEAARLAKPNRAELRRTIKTGPTELRKFVKHRILEYGEVEQSTVEPCNILKVGPEEPRKIALLGPDDGAFKPHPVFENGSIETKARIEPSASGIDRTLEN